MRSVASEELDSTRPQRCARGKESGHARRRIPQKHQRSAQWLTRRAAKVQRFLQVSVIGPGGEWRLVQIAQSFEPNLFSSSLSNCHACHTQVNHHSDFF